ncbi:DNA-binding protein [Rhizobium leguminosarum]|nr:DNA-binding protein [Rhizobium leguminosarum]TAX26335.1 hypothetical protein ELI06_24595 [Rhizobium leguminosarum]
MMFPSFDLTVSVPAEDWAYAQRRLKYLEALLMRIVRHSENQEWFTAAELAGKILPGLPTTIEGVARKASKEKWPSRKGKFQGRFFKAFHVSSLPPRAFDALISSILDLPPIDEVVMIIPNPPIPAPVAREEPTNTAPPWLLPLVRIMKTETAGNLTEAWQKLPERLPPGVPLPEVKDAAAILVHFGIVG